MAELIPSEKLQPSLLDRLRDDEPEKTKESRDKRVLSLRKLREGVFRDLTWLLNTGNLTSVTDLEDTPHIARSVLNFGLPDLSGLSASGLDVTSVERVLRQAIWDFEPRILRETLKVRVVVDEQRMNQNSVIFEIEGQLWAHPIPERLYLKTEVDLETGAVSLNEGMGSTPSAQKEDKS